MLCPEQNLLIFCWYVGFSSANLKFLRRRLRIWDASWCLRAHGDLRVHESLWRKNFDRNKISRFWKFRGFFNFESVLAFSERLLWFFSSTRIVQQSPAIHLLQARDNVRPFLLHNWRAGKSAASPSHRRIHDAIFFHEFNIFFRNRFVELAKPNAQKFR